MIVNFTGSRLPATKCHEDCGISQYIKFKTKPTLLVSQQKVAYIRQAYFGFIQARQVMVSESISFLPMSAVSKSAKR